MTRLDMRIPEADLAAFREIAASTNTSMSAILRNYIQRLIVLHKQGAQTDDCECGIPRIFCAEHSPK